MRFFVENNHEPDLPKPPTTEQMEMQESMVQGFLLLQKLVPLLLLAETNLSQTYVVVLLAGDMRPCMAGR